MTPDPLTTLRRSLVALANACDNVEILSGDGENWGIGLNRLDRKIAAYQAAREAVYPTEDVRPAGIAQAVFPAGPTIFIGESYRPSDLPPAILTAHPACQGSHS